MKRRKFLIPLLCLPAVLAGCTADIADKGWQAQRPLGMGYATYRPPVAPTATTQPVMAEESDGPLTLRQALTLAMLHSPELAGVAWDVRMAEARALQASLPPNPEIGFDLESFGVWSAAETTLQLSQVIFLSDKLWRQRQAALLERDLAGWDYEAKRLAVFTETTRAFVAVVAAQQRVRLAEELAAVSDKVLNAASERVRAGKSSPVEEMKARVELGSIRIQLQSARQEVQAARKRLVATWGGTKPKFTRAEGELQAAESIPSVDELADLLHQNPDIARWATEMQRRLTLVKLERARAIPDLTLGGGMNLVDGDIGPVVSASIPVPIFDRNQGGIRESQYNLAKVPVDELAAVAKTHVSLADAYQAMATAHAEVRVLADQVVPEAKKAFDASTEGYNQGKFAYLDVLDAQRTFFSVRDQLLTALAAYQTAAASVEGLVGQSLESIKTAPQKQEQ